MSDDVKPPTQEFAPGPVPEHDPFAPEDVPVPEPVTREIRVDLSIYTRRAEPFDLRAVADEFARKVGNVDGVLQCFQNGVEVYVPGMPR